MEFAPTFATLGSWSDMRYEPYGGPASTGQLFGHWELDTMLSGCMAPSTFAPVPNQPPTGEDWANYRTIIIDMYRRLPLHQVREQMSVLYGFIASEKMYKDRFAKWDTRKNLRRFQQKTSHNTAYPRRKDIQVVLPNRHKSSVKRPHSSSAASEAIPPITLDDHIAPYLAPQSNLKEGLKVLAALVSYLDSRLFSLMPGQFFGCIQQAAVENNQFFPMSTKTSFPLHPAQLNQNCARSTVLFGNNCPTPALQLQSQAAEMLENLFEHHHPSLTSCLLDSFVEPVAMRHNNNRDSVGRLACELSSKLPGAPNPIFALCKYLCDAGDATAEEILLWFWPNYCQLFNDKLSKTHKIAMYINYKYLEKLLQLGYYDSAFYHMIDNLDPAFTTLFHSGLAPEGLELATLCYLRRRAHVFRSIGQLQSARDGLRIAVHLILQQLSEHYCTISGSQIVEEAFRCIDEIALLYAAQGDYLEAMDLHTFALEICIAVRGVRDGKTLSMVSALEKRCKQGGLVNRALSLKLRFPHIFVDTSAHEGVMDTTVSHHVSPCPNCGNGPYTQTFCESHRLPVAISAADKVLIDTIRERLMSILL